MPVTIDPNTGELVFSGQQSDQINEQQQGVPAPSVERDIPKPSVASENENIEKVSGKVTDNHVDINAELLNRPEKETIGLSTANEQSEGGNLEQIGGNSGKATGLGVKDSEGNVFHRIGAGAYVNVGAGGQLGTPTYESGADYYSGVDAKKSSPLNTNGDKHVTLNAVYGVPMPDFRGELTSQLNDPNNILISSTSTSDMDRGTIAAIGVLVGDKRVPIDKATDKQLLEREKSLLSGSYGVYSKDKDISPLVGLTDNPQLRYESLCNEEAKSIAWELKARELGFKSSSEAESNPNLYFRRLLEHSGLLNSYGMNKHDEDRIVSAALSNAFGQDGGHIDFNAALNRVIYENETADMMAVQAAKMSGDYIGNYHRLRNDILERVTHGYIDAYKDFYANELVYGVNTFIDSNLIGSAGRWLFGLNPNEAQNVALSEVQAERQERYKGKWFVPDYLYSGLGMALDLASMYGAGILTKGTIKAIGLTDEAFNLFGRAAYRGLTWRTMGSAALQSGLNLSYFTGLTDLKDVAFNGKEFNGEEFVADRAKQFIIGSLMGGSGSLVKSNVGKFVTEAGVFAGADVAERWANLPEGQRLEPRDFYEAGVGSVTTLLVLKGTNALMERGMSIGKRRETANKVRGNADILNTKACAQQFRDSGYTHIPEFLLNPIKYMESHGIDSRSVSLDERSELGREVLDAMDKHDKGRLKDVELSALNEVSYLANGMVYAKPIDAKVELVKIGNKFRIDTYDETGNLISRSLPMKEGQARKTADELADAGERALIGQKVVESAFKRNQRWAEEVANEMIDDLMVKYKGNAIGADGKPNEGLFSWTRADLYAITQWYSSSEAIVKAIDKEYPDISKAPKEVAEQRANAVKFIEQNGDIAKEFASRYKAKEEEYKKISGYIEDEDFQKILEKPRNRRTDGEQKMVDDYLRGLSDERGSANPIGKATIILDGEPREVEIYQVSRNGERYYYMNEEGRISLIERKSVSDYVEYDAEKGEGDSHKWWDELINSNREKFRKREETAKGGKVTDETPVPVEKPNDGQEPVQKPEPIQKPEPEKKPEPERVMSTGEAITDGDIAEMIKRGVLKVEADEVADPNIREILIETIEADRQKSRDYAEGKTYNEPATWDYWRVRDGLLEREQEEASERGEAPTKADAPASESGITALLGIDEAAMPSQHTEQPQAGTGGVVAGAPADYTADMELTIRDNGEEKPAMVMGRVRYEGGQFVLDANGNIVEYFMDGEVKHERIDRMNDKVVSHVPMEKDSALEPQEPVAENEMQPVDVALSTQQTGRDGVRYAESGDAEPAEDAEPQPTEPTRSSLQPTEQPTSESMPKRGDGAGGDDAQGNRLNSDGSLYVEQVTSVDDITDADFDDPMRSIALPNVPDNVREAICAGDKPIIIKKNIFERNAIAHSDLSAAQSREILRAALYDPDLYGQNQRSRKPHNWVVINTKGEDNRNRLVLLEVNQNNDNVEIVHWHYIDERGLEKLRRQADREDGQLLILPSVQTEEVGALSDPTVSMTSESKGSENNFNGQISVGENVDSMPMVRVRGKMKPDWSKATPARAHRYIYQEKGLSRDESNAFVKANMDAIDKELQKQQKKAPKMGTDIDEYTEQKQAWQQGIDELNTRKAYWESVKAEQSKVVAAERERRAAEDAVRHDEAVAEVQADYEARKKAEAERKAVGNENPMPAITEKWNSANKVDGHRDEIMLPDGTPLKGHYVLHESGASSPSHNPETWQKTDGFPMDANDNSVNDRDYERDRDAQEHTQSIARQYDQRALQSVPVVSNDGVVLSGNGRTMAGELAARDNTDGAYVNYLKEYAPKFGFTAEQVGAMQHPRVSFVPDEAMPYTAETFAKFNQQEMKSQNKTEQAVKLGKTVSDDSFKRIVRAINGYDTLGDFYNDPKASLGAVYDLHNAGVIPQAQLAEMVDGVRGNEKLSAIGREMLENMLIGKAFEGDPDVVRMLTAEPAMRQTVITALGEIVDNIALGNDWSLQSELSDAVRLCSDARQSGAKYGDIVSIYARQGVLFADPDGLQTAADFNNATMLMLADVLNDKRVTLLKTTIQLYNNNARESAAGQGDLFADGIRSREDVLRDVITFINENYGKRKEIEAARAAAVERRKAESVQQDGTPPAVSAGSEDAGGNQRSEATVERQGDLAQAEVTAPLSEEVNEFNKPFIISSSGTTTFGEVGAESGLTAAPIKLSLGENVKDDNGANHGYGWLHIEAGHGEQIRMAGFASVEEFVETVARNYDTIREGSIIADNQTYLLEISDEHNNTLFIQLSRDGSYWNVNSAGIFKKKYSRRKPEVFTRPALKPDTNTDTSGVDSGQSRGVTTPAGNSPQTSAGKGSEKKADNQTNSGKVAKNRVSYDREGKLWGGIPEGMKVFSRGEADRYGEVYGYPDVEGVNDVELVYDEPHDEAHVRVWVSDRQAETPERIVERLEREGVELDYHSERGVYRDFDNWDEAVAFERRVREIEADVHNPEPSAPTRYERMAEERRANGGAGELSEQEKELRDALVETMRGAGIEVITDDAEGQRVLDAARRAAEALDEMKKTARETAVPGEKTPFKAAVVSSADGAKVIKNLESGINALRKIADGAERVPNAMTREDLSQYGGDNGITFLFGKPGDPSRDYKGGYGIAHIGGKHGAETLLHVLNVIANGKIDRYVEGNKTVVLSDGDYEVVLGLTRFGDKETWLFNGWKKDERTGANGEVSAHSDATQANPTFSREDLGAVLSDAKVQRIIDIAQYSDEKIREMRVWHGSGADFDAFDHSHMGEGEGAQAYGWGTYVTEVEGVARSYAVAASYYRYKGRRVNSDPYSRIPADRALFFIEQERGVDNAIKFVRTEYRLADDAELKQEYKEVLEVLLDRENWKTPDHVLYDVEIPEDNGTNYLEWDKPLEHGRKSEIVERLHEKLLAEDEDGSYDSEAARKGLADELRSAFNSDGLRGGDVYGSISAFLGSDRAASEFLHDCGFVGIEYPTNYRSGGNERGNKNYVIFNEGDAKITGKTQYFRTSRGEVYGFTKDGKIYIDPRIATAETPIHEYSHLWSDALEQANPEAWKHLKDQLLKDEDLSEYVKMLYPELADDENELAHEVFAHFGGRRGAERLRKEMRREMDKHGDPVEKARVAVMFNRLKSLLSKYWQMARDLFAGNNSHLKEMSVEDFADMAMTDLLKGVKPGEGQSGVWEMNMTDARTYDGMEDVNERFNEDLVTWYHGDMPSSRHFSIGTPMGVLARFMPMKPIILRQKVLTKALKKHGLTTSDIKDLPSALTKPIFVFQNSPRTISVLTELKSKDGKNLFVAIKLDVIKQMGHEFLEVNDVLTVHGREEENIIKPIMENNSLLWVDKEKGQRWLSSAKSNSQAFTNDDLVSAAKVIENFENPSINGKKSLSEDVTEDTAKYRIREDEPPKKTGIGYKVFVLKDGKLYPPMVANPNGEATPVGVWLDADAAPVAGVTKTGRLQVKAGGKGTQGGSGKLAYRPGWHLGEIPYASQFNRMSPETGQRELFPANFVWAEVEYANDVDYQEEAMSYGMNANGKFQHSLAGLPRLPENGSYRYRTNPDPNTDPWVITGAMKVNRILKPSEVDAMVEAAGREPQQRQAGAITDEQVEALNAKVKRTMQEDRDMMRSAAEQMGEKLHTDINIIEDVNEITHPNAAVQERRRKSKGWYDTAKGQVNIVLDNNKNIDDVKASVGHETIAHKGLRELVGEDNYDEFLDETYQHLRDDLKKGVDDAAGRAFLSGVAMVSQHTERRGKSYEECRRDAVDELFGRLAEKPFEEFSEGERTLWQKIKATVRRLLDKFLGSLKLPKWFELGDNELRYILWRSKERLERGREHPIDLARDIVKREELGLSDNARDMMGEEAAHFHTVIDEMFDNADFDKTAHQRERYDLGKTPTWMKRIGIAGDRFSLSFKNIKTHKGKDADHDLTREEWHQLPDALKNPFAVTRYNDASDRFRLYVNIMHNGNYVAVGVDVKRVNQGRNLPMLEVNSIKTVFAHHGEIGGGEKLITYDKEITPEQEALLRGLDFREYPSIQELSVAKVGRISETASNVNQKVGENTDLYRDGDETGDVWSDGSMGLQERITAAATRLAANHQENKTLRNDAMRAIGGNLADLAKSMLGRPRKTDLTDAERGKIGRKVERAAREQMRFDKTTVKRVADLARVLITNGYINNATSGEIKRLLSAVKNSVGHNDIEGDVQKVMDIMVDNQLKNAENTLHELEAIRGSKVDARGVEVQGQLDPAGQVMMRAFKDGRSLSREALEEEIGKALDRMSSESESVREDAENAYAGLQFALQYADKIADSKHEEKVLRDELKQKHDETSERDRATDSYRQWVASTEDAIRQNKIDRIQAYHDLISAMSDDISKSAANARKFKESERKRVEAIHHFANSDMQGRVMRGHRADSRLDRWNESNLLRFALSPLHSFDQFMRLFGSKNADGKGYLYDHFMRNFIDSADREWLMKEKYEGMLAEKVKELFGTHRVAWNGGMKKVPYTYTSLYGYVDALPMCEVTYYDGAAKRTYNLSQAQLGYLYAVDKMPMGKATNRRMGVSDEVMEQIEGFLDPKLKEFIDWLQEDFLVGLGNECNEVHKRMFGANMASIENYFPFVRDKNAIKREVENGAGESMAERISTKTGAIIKRTPSVANWDLPNANFLDVVAKHVSEMCQWASYAELNRDLGTLQSYNRFKQQVHGMRTIYGSGDNLWKRFMQTCAIAGNAYEPKRGEADKLMVQGAKGVTMGKIAFRPMTAMKQLLSLPAFFGEVDMECLSKDFATGGIASVKWAWENMPNFRKRIKSRTAGDYRLSATEYDKERGWTNRLMQVASYGMLPNIGVDAWTIALGSHAVYVKAKKKYLRQGYSEERAERRAVQDAELCFNKSQQSSEGAYMAPVQIDHTFASTTMMLFRNSSTSYTREHVTSVRNLKRMMSGEVSVDFMAKQILRNAEIPTYGMRFDKELEQQIAGELPMGHVYQLGMPGGVLQSAGFPDAPIEMSATRLAEKSSQESHPFPIGALKGLVETLNKPLAVFRYGNNAMNVIVGIEYNGKQMLVGVHFNQNRGGSEVSSVRGLFPKDNAEWLNWISQGKAAYLDHKKIQALIRQQRINLADVPYLDLESVAKVMNNFVNPAIPEQKKFSDWRDEDVEEARRQARREYRSGYIRNSVNAVMFGYILPWLWRIGGMSVLLTLGGDDEDKETEVKKSTVQSFFGPFEGIAYGDVLADGLYVTANKLLGDGEEKYANLGRTNPFLSDLTGVLRKLDGDKMSAINDVLNILVGMNTGVNLQTVSDWATAILDYSPDGDTAREVSLLVCRLLNAPQSQVDKIYFDELGMTGEAARGLSAEALVRRYAEYKMKRDHFVTPWVWGDEDLLEKKRKRGKDMVKERVERMDDSVLKSHYDHSDPLLRKFVGKEVAGRLGGTDSYGNPQNDYGQVYLQMRDYVDLAEDVTLQAALKKAKESGDVDRAKDIESARRQITEVKKDLTEVPYTLSDGTEVTAIDIMQELRDLRKSLMSELGITTQQQHNR